MKYQSQNNETEIVLNYFGEKKGTVLEIGANDGKTLSNSYDLIQKGWRAILVEPSSVYADLRLLHKDNRRVKTHNVALGKESGTIKFFESGAHVKGGNDKALVSTSVRKELQRWPDVAFEEKMVPVLAVKDFLFKYDAYKIDYISLDVEGMEMEILQEINLSIYAVDMLCVEWNGNKDLGKQFTEYCNKFGLKEIHRNAENIIYAR